MRAIAHEFGLMLTLAPVDKNSPNRKFDEQGSKVRIADMGCDRNAWDLAVSHPFQAQPMPIVGKPPQATKDGTYDTKARCPANQHGD